MYRVGISSEHCIMIKRTLEHRCLTINVIEKFRVKVHVYQFFSVHRTGTCPVCKNTGILFIATITLFYQIYNPNLGTVQLV